MNIVQQGQVGVVKRLGEYRRTHEPGLVIIAPFVDTLQRVDMREIPVPGDRQDVITRDNVVVTVNATIFTQVVDAKQALFSVKNFDIAIDALARTALRSVIGTMTLDEALSERERINTDVQQQMEVVTDKWGIRISRIEIVEIAPPPQILLALALQKQADQEKRAKILAVRGPAAVGDQRGRGRRPGRGAGRPGRAPGRHPAGRGQPPGRHPRGRGTGPGHRDGLRRDQGGRPRPDARGHPATRHARPSSPRATTPRSSCPTRARGSWVPRRRCATCSAAARCRRQPTTAPPDRLRQAADDGPITPTRTLGSLTYTSCPPTTSTGGRPTSSVRTATAPRISSLGAEPTAMVTSTPASPRREPGEGDGRLVAHHRLGVGASGGEGRVVDGDRHPDDRREQQGLGADEVAGVGGQMGLDRRHDRAVISAPPGTTPARAAPRR